MNKPMAVVAAIVISILLAGCVVWAVDEKQKQDSIDRTTESHWRNIIEGTE